MLVLAIAATACTGGGDEADRPPDAAPGADDTGPFRVRLAVGEPGGGTVEQIPVVDGDELTDAERDAVVDRLPPFEAEDGDVEAFNRPAESLPPPLVGDVVDAPFPAPQPADPPAPATGPLQVLRHQPDGDVPIAPFLSVTFNQPMVPLGTLGQLDQADVPVVVTPALPGRWRWIGTSTLRYEHTADDIDRLPMATEYRVEVPAGTTSATGGALAEPASFTFRTPPPTVTSFGPMNDSLPLEPVWVAAFDQRVEPGAVLDTIRVTAADVAVPLRLATDDEVAADDAATEAVAEALDGRVVAFRPVDPMPADSRVRVEIGPGTPSAEGPRTTDEPATYDGRTYGTFRVVRSTCGYGGGCQPGSQFDVELSNPLDLEAFDPATVTVEPELPGVQVYAGANLLSVAGATAADTTYRVTLDASLVDEFGQSLGEDVTEEFEVGEARPAIYGFERRLLTVDPDQGAVPIRTTGHGSVRLHLYRVAPDDFEAYVAFQDAFYNRTRPSLEGMPGEEVVDRVLDIDEAPGGLTETTVDLGDVLGGGPGHVIVAIEPTEPYPTESDLYWQNVPTFVWVQATTLAVDAFADPSSLVTWVTDLRSGQPVEGASVALAGTGATGRTDADGVASLPLTGPVRYALATADDESAIAAQDYGAWAPTPGTDTLRWYTISDRGLYRPGETVHLRGWVRRFSVGSPTTLVPVDPTTRITYRATDAMGAELATGEVAVNDLAGFDIAITLPDGANLGDAYVELTASAQPGLAGSPMTSANFRIDEFRRPDFEVTTQPETPGPYYMTDPATVSARAGYLAGGDLADAPVVWTVTTAETTYSPPNWPDFTFGVWVPWWSDGGGYGADFGDTGPCCAPPPQPEVARLDGTTDASGRHYLRLDLEGDTPDTPVTVSANAAVEDVNRQAFASTVDLLVHPSTLYVGLRSSRTFARQGDPLTIEAIVTDVDGNPVDGRELTVTAARLESQLVDGEYTEVEVDTETCSVTTETSAVECTFDPEVGGTYRIESTVTDDAGGSQRSELTRWVSGAEALPSRTLDRQTAVVIPDAETYEVGETARLLVQSPFAGGTGLATVAGSDGVDTIRFDVVDGSAIVDVPVVDTYVPTVEVFVEVVGTSPRLADDGTPLPDAPPQPAYAVGAATLTVPPTTRELTVQATPASDAVTPGASTTVDVAVADADGEPVAGADVALVVVDEALLSLIGYDLPDPLAAFYPPQLGGLYAVYGRGTVVLTRVVAQEDEAASTTVPAVGAPASGAPAAGESAAPAGGASGGAGDADEAADGGGLARMDTDSLGAISATTPIDVRTNFDALAAYVPSLTTDDDGNASAEVTLPDSVTRYRIMAVAATADRFGTGESTLTARLPLTVRPSAPRFLNFGDAFELPVVVQNQGDTELAVDIVVEATNLELGRDTRRVSVPAGDRVEVRFPADAAEAGTARYRVTGVSGELADSATGELPVYTPTTTEAFATYGVLDGGVVAQPLLTPTGVVPQFGGLEIDTSSTAVQALTDAVGYLADYPYETADAYASRILALAALRDVLSAFDAEGVPEPAELNAMAQGDVDALVALQTDDGGFAVFKPIDGSEPYHSVQGTHALVAARAAGYAVPAEALDAAVGYLRSIESHVAEIDDEQARNALIAYALNVRNQIGDRDAAAASALFAGNPDLALDAVAWLWPVVDDAATSAAIERLLLNRVVETPAGASFTTGYDESASLVLASDRRTDGLVLDALIQLRPGSDLIPRVVAGLVGNQVRGRWGNVQENAFILLALKRYFDTFEAQTPDFVARVWLGDLYASERAFVGRSTETANTLVPMSELLARDDPQVVVQQDGTGRLYYRLGLTYAPSDLALDARDEGFVVDRSYEPAVDDDDVTRDADGTWRIEAGAEVRVRLTIVADSARTNVALVDPLPAGFEIVNPDLAASPAEPSDPEEGGEGEPSTWWGPWFDHQNLRDDRAEAFAYYLPAGTYEYTFVARATTPGTFVVPPTKAEEMYAPEVFGRAATDRVVIG